MDELGGFMGFLTVILLGLALLNYVVKRVNRFWVAKLPKESKFKAAYGAVMKFLVRNHRFFGLGAALTLAVHVVLQIMFRWVSVTGLIASALLGLEVIMGAWLYFKQKGRRGILQNVHRATGAALIVAIAVHVITKL